MIEKMGLGPFNQLDHGRYDLMLRHSRIPCPAPDVWRIPTLIPVAPGIDDVLLFFEYTDKMAD